MVAWRNKCIIWNKVGKERIAELWKVVAENLYYGSMEMCVCGGQAGEGRVWLTEEAEKAVGLEWYV